MKSFISNVIANYRQQLVNFLCLSCIQSVNLISPLVTLPFLIVKLGIHNYGLIAFAQTIMIYISTFINFGFNVTGTKKISESRHNKKLTDEITSVIYAIKFAIYLTILILLFCIYLIFSYFIVDMTLFYLILLYAIATFYDVFFPVWYFLGKEQMLNISITNALSKLIFCILIFFFIENESNILLVPILLIGSNLFAISFPLFVLFKRERFKFLIPNKSQILSTIKDAFIYFMSDVMALIKDRTNIIIISFLSMSSVAYFDIMQKIIELVRNIFVNFNNAFFPLIVRSKRIKDIRVGIWSAFFVSIFFYLVVVSSSNILIYILSKGIINNDLITFSIAALFIVTASMSSAIGLFILIPNGLQNKFLYNLFLATVIYLSLIGILFLFNSINLRTVIIAYNVSVFLELCHRLFICYKFKLIGYLFKKRMNNNIH